MEHMGTVCSITLLWANSASCPLRIHRCPTYAGLRSPRWFHSSVHHVLEQLGLRWQASQKCQKQMRPVQNGLLKLWFRPFAIFIWYIYIYVCDIYIYGILKLSLGCSFSFRCLFDISKMQSWRAWRVMPFRWNPWELVIFLMDSNHQTTDSCQKRGWCHHHHHHHRRKVSLYFLD